MMKFIIPLGLLSLGMLLLASEVFVPSAGILGVLAVVSLIAGVSSAYYYGGIVVGTIVFAITLAICAVLISSMIKWWPQTRLGKRILVQPVRGDDVLPDRSAQQSLLGAVGQAVSVMLPSGRVEIYGKQYDATARTSVESGEWLKVIEVRGRNLIVRTIDEEVARQELAAHARVSDPLSQPVEEIVADPFEDPLG